MFSSQCLFCDHVNPTDAKFCNNCGASLQVKPCSRCEAVNDQTAKSCHKCGTKFPAPATAVGISSTSSAPNVTTASPALGDPLPFRLDFDTRELPELSASAELVTAPEHGPIPTEVAAATANWPASQVTRTAEAIALDKRDLAFDRQPSNFEQVMPAAFAESGREGATSELESGRQRATAEVSSRHPEVIAELRPLSRVASVMAASAVALIAIGLLAYYVYGPSMLPGERESPPAASGSPSDVNAGRPPTPTSPVGVAASPEPSAGGTSNAAAIGATPERSVVPSPAVPTSPVGQTAAAAAGSIGAAGQTPSPTEAHRQVPTRDGARPSEELAARADGIAKKPDAATANAGTVREGTTPATGNEVTAKRSVANRPTRSYPPAIASEPEQLPLKDTRATVRPDASRSRACTEGVAALGLCSRNSEGENK